MVAYSGKQETEKSIGKLGFCRVNCNFVSKEWSIVKVTMKFFEGGKIITLYRVKNYKIMFRRFQTPNWDWQKWSKRQRNRIWSSKTKTNCRKLNYTIIRTNSDNPEFDVHKEINRIFCHAKQPSKKNLIDKLHVGYQD